MGKSIFIAKPYSRSVYHDTDALAAYALRTSFPVLRDRFGFLNKFSNWLLYDIAIPFPSTHSRAVFSDIMDQRAADILKLIRKEEKDLYIFLSGGVDSTAMTIAVLRAADGDMRNLHIVYNTSTEEEYPDFVQYVRSIGIDMVRCISYKIDEFHAALLEDSYTLTGWGADQLFGSIINQRWPDWFSIDWKKWVKEFLVDGGKVAIPQWEAAFKHYGIPVRTFGELAWFMNFTTKYDIVTHSDVLYSGKITNRMICFYDTQEFNDWSVSNFDILHRYPQQDTVHYKEQIKDYIFCFNHDSAYRQGKGKVGSWARAKSLGNAKFYARACVMETPDYVVYRKDRTLRRFESFVAASEIMAHNLLRSYRKS